MITAHNLQRHPWKIKKLHCSPRKLLPDLLATGGWSMQLEADLLSGEETRFFDAVLSSTSLSTCLVDAERPGWTRSAIASPDDEESDASRTARSPESPNDEVPRRGTVPPKQVGRTNSISRVGTTNPQRILTSQGSHEQPYLGGTKESSNHQKSCRWLLGQRCHRQNGHTRRQKTHRGIEDRRTRKRRNEPRRNQTST